MTFEELYLNCGNDDATNDAYSAAREAKVAEIARYIAGYLKSPQHAGAIADEAMNRAEQFGRISGDAVSSEIASRYTASGNPLTFVI